MGLRIREMIPSVPYKIIELTQGQVAYVSPYRYGNLSTFKWHAVFDKTINGFYAVRRFKKQDGTFTVISMHRQIMGLEPGDKGTVDHLNHDSLDNTDENLRVLSVM